MNDQERAAMQQALNAVCGAKLCEFNSMSSRQERLRLMDEATAILSAALAQEQPEPSGYCTLEQLVVMQRTVPSPDKIAIYTAPPKAEPAQEPVAQAMQDAAVYGVGISRDGKRIDPASIYEQPAQEPEPVQKPVAWNWMLDGRPYGQAYYGNPPDADIVERAAIAGRTVRLLYTAPPQRQPLTDEEIDEIFRDLCSTTTGASYRTMARAIERKVRGE